MPHIVTRLCRDCKHTACVTVCPVDCFYEPIQPTPDLPDQLYISPNECIDCRACIPECPWEAIYEDVDLPEIFKDDIELNARCDVNRELFRPAQEIPHQNPTEEEVRDNKRKWGWVDQEEEVEDF